MNVKFLQRLINLIFFPAMIIFFAIMFIIRTKELKGYRVYDYLSTAKTKSLNFQNLPETEIDRLCIDNLLIASMESPNIFLRINALLQGYQYAKNIFIEYTLAALKFPYKANVLQYFRSSANIELNRLIAVS